MKCGGNVLRMKLSNIHTHSCTQHFETLIPLCCVGLFKNYTLLNIPNSCRFFLKVQSPEISFHHFILSLLSWLQSPFHKLRQDFYSWPHPYALHVHTSTVFIPLHCTEFFSRLVFSLGTFCTLLFLHGHFVIFLYFPAFSSPVHSSHMSRFLAANLIQSALHFEENWPFVTNNNSCAVNFFYFILTLTIVLLEQPSLILINYIS